MMVSIFSRKQLCAPADYGGDFECFDWPDSFKSNGIIKGWRARDGMFSFIPQQHIFFFFERSKKKAAGSTIRYLLDHKF